MEEGSETGHIAGFEGGGKEPELGMWAASMMEKPKKKKKDFSPEASRKDHGPANTFTVAARDPRWPSLTSRS